MKAEITAITARWRVCCTRDMRRGRYGCLFLQAEDGIRDATVTGVQTCALPISGRQHLPRHKVQAEISSARDWRPRPGAQMDGPRSEERRVGTECRSRRAPY